VPVFSIVKLQDGVRQIDREKAVAALRDQKFLLDAPQSPHLVLRPSAPSVKDRGWLVFEGGTWSVYADPNNDFAAWNRISMGWIEVWLKKLIPGAMYVVMIDVSSYTGSTPNPSFLIRTSDGQKSYVSAPGGFSEAQVLLVVIKPSSDMSWVTVYPQGVADWSFYSVEVHKVA
jgi:hypothetical protein